MASITIDRSYQDIFADKIEIKQTKNRGRGVFANKLIFKDEIIESCQIIPFSADDADKIETTFLSNYWYAWRTDDDPTQYGALCLGNGSLYNHSQNPNAMVIKDYDHNLIIFVASKNIEKGTEITVKYGTVWFKEEEEKEEKSNFIN